ncbi:MAG: DUF3810 domain-containing protein [Clostridia bacterium]
MKRLFLLLLVPLGYVLTLISSSFPDFTESFISLGFYKIYSQVISFIFGLFPFSVAEFSLVFGVLAIVGLLIYSAYKSIRYKQAKSILSYVKNLAVTASVVYFVFVISCGLNYNRYNFEYYYGTEKETYTAEQLAELCVYLVTTGGEIGETLTEEDYNFSAYELSDMSFESFSSFKEQYSVFDATYSKPKPIILSALMSNTEITGFFYPFTIEANVNVDIPSYQIPFTMMHEEAHQYGFMREDEANFISWLAGKNSDYNFVRYSVYMQASVYAMNSLYEVDQDAFNEIYSLYTDKQMADKIESSEYWEQFRDTVVSDTFNQINDNYLKANGQEDGVISYSKVTELLLMDYFTE